MASAACVVCDKSFDLPEGAAVNKSSSFFLTAADQLELYKIKNASFAKNKRGFFYITRQISNHSLNNTDGLGSILTDAPARHTIHVEDSESPSILSGLLAAYNWTTVDSTDDAKFSEPYHLGEKTIIRTMPDRNANINDIVWVIKRANNHNTDLNAFFLHKNNVLWVSIPPPPHRTNDEQLAVDRDINVLTSQLKKFFLFKRNFKRINKMILGTGAITFFKYPTGGRLRRLVISFFPGFAKSPHGKTGPMCQNCSKAYTVPATAELNSVNHDDANEYYLTKGDLVTLTNIKDEAFTSSPTTVRLGFITRPTTNLSVAREFASRINEGSVRDVIQSAPYVNRFKRVIRYFRPCSIDDMMSNNYNGENVMFRTMTDINANAHHVAWLIERAHDQGVEMNAFFLHKRNFIWVKVAHPLQRNVEDQERAANALEHILADLRKNVALHKSTIPDINKKLRGIARIGYKPYPDRKWMDTVMEADAEDKMLIFTLATGLAFAAGAYYTSGSEEWDWQPRMRTLAQQPDSRNDHAGVGVPQNMRERLNSYFPLSQTTAATLKQAMILNR